MEVINRNQATPTLAVNTTEVLRTQVPPVETAVREAPRPSGNYTTSKAPSKPAITSVGPYNLGKTLGLGTTGVVKLGVHFETNQKVAVKIINRETETHHRTSVVNNKIEREIAIMKLIEHPNILSLYDVYENDGELYLVMELVEGGELFDYLIQKGKLKEAEALKYFHHIVSGLDYCHKHFICHRDLKPENLLLDGDMNIKIADFGMASLQRTGKLLETSCGSPHYASPEIIKGVKYDGATSDVWSCGVILFALLTGSLPFDDKSIRKLLTKVKQGVYTIPSYVPEGARDLITRMLHTDPAQRITLKEVQEHPWFNRRPYLAHQHIPPNVQSLPDRRLIDPDIIESLGYLGWGGPNGNDNEALIESLMNSEKNQQKVFYHLLAKRKQLQFATFDAVNSPVTPFMPSSPRRRQSSYGSMFLDHRSQSTVSIEGSQSLSPSPLPPPQLHDTAEFSEGRPKVKADGSRWSSFTPGEPTLTVPKAIRPDPTSEAPKKLTISTGHSNPLLHAAVVGAANSPKSAPISAPKIVLPSPTFTNSYKKSWFANLFNFRPESVSIDIEGKEQNIIDNLTQTLQDLNVAMQESSRDTKQWKCRYEEPVVMKDEASSAATSLKFRISLESSEKPDKLAENPEDNSFKIVILQQQGTALMFEKFTYLFMNKWNGVVES